MAYPYYDELQRLVPNMKRGNFGLWYNKFIPLNDFKSCKASDARGNDKNAVSYYCQQYNNTHKDTIKKLLDKRHYDQAGFCECLSRKYEKVIFKAKLKTSLITGIGETHPHEVSMVFDHNMGIPYIPASGIKGIVRFSHTIGLLADIPSEKIVLDDDGKEWFDDEKDWTNVPQLFGTQERRGRVVFLDAYPEKVPDLHVDIMNPHYGKYYSDDQNETPPGDYLDPNPIKFLTVAKGAVFVFRALVDKESSEFIDKVRTAFKKAITEEGVGAKTAVGYGVFEDLKEEESESVLELIRKENERKAQEAEAAIAMAKAERRGLLSEDEKMIEDIRKLQKDPSQILPLIAKCLTGDFEQSVYATLKETLANINEWKPAGSKQRKKKMRDRNAKIEAKINS